MIRTYKLRNRTIKA